MDVKATDVSVGVAALNAQSFRSISENAQGVGRLVR